MGLNCEALLMSFAKAAFKVLQETGGLAYCCTDVWLGPAEATAIGRMKQPTSVYGKLSREGNEGQPPPPLPAYICMPEGSAAAAEEAGDADALKDEIKQAMDEAEGKLTEELTVQVRFGKAAEDPVKLTLCLTKECQCKEELENGRRWGRSRLPTSSGTSVPG